MDEKIVYALIAVILMLISFYAGVYYGTKQTLSFITNVGFELLKQEKIDLDIDKDFLVAGIMQYKENIGGCLFTNASVFNDERD